MSATAAWRRMFVAVPVLLVAALAFSLIIAAPADAAKSKRERKIHHGLEVAIRQKGDPYVYGASGPGAFDCSGLTTFAFDRAGFSLPRSSDAQARHARRIPKQNLHRGDFVFFTSGGSVYHVGIYLGHHDGRRWILHAPYSGKVVQRDAIWTNAWFAGTLRHRR